MLFSVLYNLIILIILFYIILAVLYTIVNSTLFDKIYFSYLNSRVHGFGLLVLAEIQKLNNYFFFFVISAFRLKSVIPGHTTTLVIFRKLSKFIICLRCIYSNIN